MRGDDSREAKSKLATFQEIERLMALPDRESRWRRWFRPQYPVWGYLAILLGTWAAIFLGGDRWWLPTVLMFAPKWVYAVPLAFLAVWLAIARASRRVWAIWTAATLVWLIPVAGFCVPWRTFFFAVPVEPELCVLTFNSGRGRADPAALAELIAEVAPDIVCLQECNAELAKIFDEGWHVLRAGGLLVASHYEIESVGEVKRDLPNRWPRGICYIVRVARGDRPFHMATLHLFSPRYGLAEIADSTTGIAPWKRGTLLQQIAYRRSESEQVSGRLAEVDGPLLIAGDFNTPVESTIFRENWGGYRDAFYEAGWGFGSTVRIVEGGITFTSRIDHILASDQWVCSESRVGPDVGSDHWPVIARFTMR